jgi:Flp pilus assembly protein CpaB
MSRGARILIALALGGLAALFGMLYLSSERTALLGSSEMVRVYVAADDIPANVNLEKDMISVREIPKTFLQPQSIPVADVPDKAKLKGVTLVEIKEGEQIVRTKLFEGAPPSLSNELKTRQNLVAVGVKMASLPHSVHGLIQPGDRVDILASFEFEKTDGEPFTEVRPMYQNVEVLSVNDRTASNIKILGAEKAGGEQAEQSTAKTVGLALPPAAAQQVVLAQQLGDIWMILRAPGDSSQHQYEIWNNERLLQSPYKLWHARDNRAEVMRQITQR